MSTGRALCVIEAIDVEMEPSGVAAVDKMQFFW